MAVATRFTHLLSDCRVFCFALAIDVAGGVAVTAKDDLLKA
jgi:hypothetical protein